MLERFQKFIQRHQLFTRNQKILVGVSGGVDSVALCELLHLANVQFAIAHCNFHLRGGESDADELFVSALAAKYGVPFFRNDFDTRTYADQHGVSIQMAARDLRFTWFENIRRSNGFDLTAIASQLNDDIETVIINLTRGTGLRGITGIPVKNRNVIRPLLFASREDILKFAKEQGIQWREDSSNDETVYLRNNIRKNVIPVLKSANPNLEQTFQQNIERFLQVQDLLDRQLAKAIDECVTTDKNKTVLAIEPLNAYQPLKLFLREILLPFNFNADHVENIHSVLNGTPGKQFFSDTHFITVDRNVLFIEPIVNEQIATSTLIGKEVREILKPFPLNFEIKSKSSHQLIHSERVAQLDFEKLSFPLVLRKWQPGDAFYPLGMNQRKKLSDFFVDIKLPLNKKQETYVLLNEEHIVWVVGHRIDHRYRITDTTEKVYLVH